MKLDIFWIILMISGLSVFSKAINTSNEQDKLLQFHLQLHKNHCGDVALCDNVTDHVVQLDFITPVPCCLPCSCSSTCRIQQNCCPGFELHTENATYIGARRGLLKPNHANQSTNVAVNQGIEHMNIGNESRSMALADNGINRNEENLFDEDTFRTSNLTEQAQPLTEQAQPITEQAQSLTDDAKLKNNDTGTIDNYTICIRPQVLYKPNIFVDSNAYMMVVACIEMFQGNRIVRECRGRHGKTDISEMVPVTSKLTGLTYVNKFCLMCNEGETIEDAAIDMWEAKVVHYANKYHHRFVFNTFSLAQNILTISVGFSNIHFLPRTSNLVQQCETYDVSSCNQTGQWEIFDQMVENVCHHGHSLPILHRISNGSNAMRFKNIACVHCNLGSSFKDSTCGYFDFKHTEMHSFSLTLNLRHTDAGGKSEESLEDLEFSYTDGAVLQIPKTNICPSGYIALLGRCRRITCPRDHYISNNKCVPLYQRITGMELNVKIDISPIDKIPKTFSSAVLEELRNIVNTSLSKYVTLQPRKIAVWYGPKLSKNPDKYYMFDIFLNNSSDTIEYSTAVTEIRAFFNNLKTHKSIALSNGAEIGIEIKFNHRLIQKFGEYKDISLPNDGNLQVLVGKTSKSNDPVPNMLISNVNWCYRVPFKIFHDNEVEMIGAKVYAVKDVDITVYQHQYDQANGFNDHYLYLCLDLFISLTDEGTIINDDNIRQKTYIKDNNDDPKGTVPVSVVIVAVLVGVLVVTAFCKIQYTSRKQTVQSALQETLAVGIVSDTGMSEDRTQAFEMVYLERSRDQTDLDIAGSDKDISEGSDNTSQGSDKDVSQGSDKDVSQDSDMNISQGSDKDISQCSDKDISQAYPNSKEDPDKHVSRNVRSTDAAAQNNDRILKKMNRNQTGHVRD